MKRLTMILGSGLLGLGLLGLMTGCAGEAIKPTDTLDETTGMTVGALEDPIEFVQSAQNAVVSPAKRASFAYLGPIEWDRMGEISYGLWLHVAPGNDVQVGSIQSPGVVTLNLDDGPLVLTPTQPPAQGHGPYKPVASWGQTAYFALDMETLKRMAASSKLTLEFKSIDRGGKVAFLPSHDTSATLTEFVRTRGITAD
jgi:hypothetical protein